MEINVLLEAVRKDAISLGHEVNFEVDGDEITLTLFADELLEYEVPVIQELFDHMTKVRPDHMTDVDAFWDVMNEHYRTTL